jgi:two-component system sensor histidine kinase TtrS
MRQRLFSNVMVAVVSLAGFFFACESHGADVVRIGVLAKRGPEKCLAKWGPTADYLSEKLGRKVVIQPMKFDAVPVLLKAKKVDFFLVNSSMYCDMQAQFGGSPVVSLINERQGNAVRQFGGVLFTKADSAIETVEDVRGKRFMCVKKSSFGGYQMAQRLLLNKGINPETDCALFKEAGTHDKVVEMVQKGVIEVGTVRSDTLERMEAEGKCKVSDFRILNKQEVDFPFVISTQLYPEWPMAVCEHTDPALAEEVKAGLLSMTKDTPAAKTAKCAGWCEPLDYTSVVECLKEIGFGALAKLAAK